MSNYQKLEEIRARLPDGDDYGRRLCDELMADEEKVLAEVSGEVYRDEGVGLCDLALEEYLPDGIEPQFVTVIIKRREP